MSAERRWNERRYYLEESTTQNNGKRAVFIEHMSPGTAVPPHWHSRFSETFDMISGAIKVYQYNQAHSEEANLAALEASAQDLEVGKLVTVTPKVYHKYLAGDQNTTLRVIVTPGDADFERLLMILNGLAEDGELEKLGNSVILMAVIMNLSNAYILGPMKQMLDGVWAENREEILALKETLLAKYDNEEQLKKLLAK